MESNSKETKSQERYISFKILWQALRKSNNIY